MGIPLPAGVGASGAPPAGDQANFVIAGTFAAAGQSAPFCIYGGFNFAIWGETPTTVWTGSVQLERSFDGGTTWLVCGVGGAGASAIYTGAGQAGNAVNVVASEPEKGVAYRLNCTALSAGGPLNYRISGSGLAAMAWGVPGS